ncbi:uncharacterized protein LOC126380417 [Pectinophora gossypiella]|uniref:uncharacterized protein LOC126380417 n=1 Tax=Pectinophora gossypiella TaxID=13191 RepID=UPI00214F39E6|nr:uncharacterized protein LOC126380417 [Pectinophora gossypiella]
MGQKSILNAYCPLSTRCCFCVNLRYGTIAIAVLGFLMSIFYMALLDAEEFLKDYVGMHPVTALIIVHTYAILGVLMNAINIILFAASFTYNEFYILMYLWFAIIFFIFDFLMVMITTIAALSAKKALFAVAIFCGDIAYWVILYNFAFPAVNGFRRSIHTVVIFLG